MGDIRYALRNLLRRPTFTLIAVVTLALGIGALLLKPLPFPELDRVITIWDKLPSRGVMHNEVTVANYLDWQSQTQSFDQLALYRWWSANLTGIDPPERIQGFLVTANFLHDLVQRVKAQPGVQSAAFVNYVPLGGANSSNSYLVDRIGRLLGAHTVYREVAGWCATDGSADVQFGFGLFAGGGVRRVLPAGATRDESRSPPGAAL